MLDPCFSRRYSCLLRIHDRFYDEALARCHAKFSRKPEETLSLALALRRATAGRTTVQQRASYDKAFDLSAVHYHACSIYFDAESHPMLTFQA